LGWEERFFLLAVTPFESCQTLRGQITIPSEKAKAGGAALFLSIQHIGVQMFGEDLLTSAILLEYRRFLKLS
jgi:hypothetical protein